MVCWLCFPFLLFVQCSNWFTTLFLRLLCLMNIAISSSVLHLLVDFSFLATRHKPVFIFFPCSSTVTSLSNLASPVQQYFPSSNFILFLVAFTVPGALLLEHLSTETRHQLKCNKKLQDDVESILSMSVHLYPCTNFSISPMPPVAIFVSTTRPERKIGKISMKLPVLLVQTMCPLNFLSYLQKHIRENNFWPELKWKFKKSDLQMNDGKWVSRSPCKILTRSQYMGSTKCSHDNIWVNPMDVI